MNQFVVLPLRAELIEEGDAWVRKNIQRHLPAAPYGTQQGGALSICGNGPSLRTDWPENATRRVAALNGAWRALPYLPDYIVAFDPSPENIGWFVDAPVGPMYLLASCMHPTVFDILIERGCDVRMWHTNGNGERNAGLGPLIGGGFTIGCASLNLFHLIGFDHFDCYGMDSCYAIDGAHHAAKQDWNITTPDFYQVGERSFMAEPWMAAQVEQFLVQIEANRWNYSVDVKGDGFLATALEHNTFRALYDLDVAPGSFDFMCSMLNVENYRQAARFTRAVVHFKPGSNAGFRPVDVIDVGQEQKNLMLNNVVRPLVKLFGMSEVGEMPKPHASIGRIEAHSEGVVFAYSPRFSVEYFNETGNLPEYKASARATRWAEMTFSVRPYVITLREAAHWPQRNSDVAEWLKFAATLDGPVVFVRDTATADEPLEGVTCPLASRDLDKRLALYRRARMNFFVTNGPGGLAWYSKDIPYLCLFKDAPGYHCYDPAWLEDYIGLPQGGQYPWAGPHQRLAYVNDTCENIQAAWREMQAQMVAPENTK